MKKKMNKVEQKEAKKMYKAREPFSKSTREGTYRGSMVHVNGSILLYGVYGTERLSSVMFLV